MKNTLLEVSMPWKFLTGSSTLGAVEVCLYLNWNSDYLVDDWRALSGGSPVHCLWADSLAGPRNLDTTEVGVRFSGGRQEFVGDVLSFDGFFGARRKCRTYDGRCMVVVQA